MKDTTGRETRLQALANLIAAEIEAAPPRPKLRIVRKHDLPERPAERMDPATRESYLRLIRGLAKAYKPCGMQLIVDRAVAGRQSINDLTDDEVMRLHRDVYRGLECIKNDVPFEHVGLIDEGEQGLWVA